MHNIHIYVCVYAQCGVTKMQETILLSHEKNTKL